MDSPTQRARDAATIAARNERRRTNRFITRLRHKVEERQVEGYRAAHMPPVTPLEQELVAHPDRHCRNADINTFYPVGSGKKAQQDAEHAKAICENCPVRQLCLMVSLERADEYAVMGGMTALERKEIYGVFYRRRAS